MAHQPFSTPPAPFALDSAETDANTDTPTRPPPPRGDYFSGPSHTMAAAVAPHGALPSFEYQPRQPQQQQPYYTPQPDRYAYGHFPSGQQPPFSSPPVAMDGYPMSTGALTPGSEHVPGWSSSSSLALSPIPGHPSVNSYYGHSPMMPTTATPMGYPHHHLPQHPGAPPMGHNAGLGFTGVSHFASHPMFGVHGHHGGYMPGSIMEPPAPEVKKRSRIAQACERCRIRKARCFGGNPCNRCVKRRFVCEFASRPRTAGSKSVTQSNRASSASTSEGVNTGTSATPAKEPYPISTPSSSSKPLRELSSGASSPVRRHSADEVTRHAPALSVQPAPERSFTTSAADLPPTEQIDALLQSSHPWQYLAVPDDETQQQVRPQSGPSFYPSQDSTAAFAYTPESVTATPPSAEFTYTPPSHGRSPGPMVPSIPALSHMYPPQGDRSTSGSWQ